MVSWSLFRLPSRLLVSKLDRYRRACPWIIDFVVVLVHHLLFWIRKNGIPALNILHLNGTRFTIIPRKFLQSAKEFGCYTIMCVVIYI